MKALSFKLVIGLLLCQFIIGQSIAQDLSTKWLPIVKESYQRTMLPKKGTQGVFYTDYSIVMYDSKNTPISTQRVQQYVQGEQTRIVTQGLDIYIDKSFMITKVEADRTLILSDLKDVPEDKKNRSVGIMADTLWEYFEVLNVSKMEKGGSSDKIITLKPKSTLKIKGVKEISTIRYYLNTSSKRVYRTEVIYKPGFKLSKQVITIKTANQLYSGSRIFSKSVFLHFFEKENVLRQKYIGYEVVTSEGFIEK